MRLSTGNPATSGTELLQITSFCQIGMNLPVKTIQVTEGSTEKHP
jgi:hypothetical protein